MDTTQQTLKRSAAICMAVMAILFVLGVVFYKERVLFSDASFIFFTIVNDHKLFFPHGRYGVIFTQLFPYLGQQIHLPLNTLVFLYGMSFYLFYLSAASVLFFWLKQYRFVILMTLFYCLFVSQSFIWTDEIPSGIAWMSLLFGVTIYLGNKGTNTFLLLIPFTILGFLTLYTHIAVMIPTAFLWIYFILEKKNWPFSVRTTMILSCVAIAIVIIKIKIAMSGVQATYDNNELQGVLHASIKDIFTSLDTPVIKMFLYRCATNYWAGIIVLILGIIDLIRNKSYKLAAWTLLSFFGYFVLMGLTYGTLDQGFLLIHAETEWVCIGIIAATPWVFSYLQGRTQTFTPLLLAAIFAIRLVYIIIPISIFTERTRTDEQIVAQMRKKGITKLAVYRNEALSLKNILDWGAPFESAIMSQINGEKPQRTFVYIDKGDLERIRTIQNTQGMAISWGVMDKNSFNHAYFQIDTAAYQFMTYDEIIK